MFRGFGYLAILVISIVVVWLRVFRAKSDEAAEDETRLEQGAWSCPECGESVPGSFSICWNRSDATAKTDVADTGRMQTASP